MKFSSIFAQWLSLAIVLMGTISFSSARNIDISPTINAAMRADLKNGERKDSSATVIAKLKEARAISRSPVDRRDYTDYYLVDSGTMYAGHDVLLVEHEHFGEYVGCCVNPGLALVIRVKHPIKSLKRIAENLGCDVTFPFGVRRGEYGFKELDAIPANELAHLNCRQMNWNAATVSR